MQSLSRDTRSLWRETTQNLEAACGWRPVTPAPDEIADLTAPAIEKLRATDDINNRHVLTVWNQWTIARSFQIADNIGRLRALLRLVLYWRTLQRENPGDSEAAQGVLTGWHFARDHWGVQSPPIDPRRWDGYCETHVLEMVRRKEREARR